LIAAGATLLAAVACAEDYRQPNEFERAYTAITLDIESHELCEKISPRARGRFPFNSPGTQVYFERSRCFFYVAAKQLNPHFCKEVTEARGFRLDGSYFSGKNCRDVVAAGKRLNFTTSFDHEKILRAAGYTDGDVRRRFPKHPEENSWMLFYHDFFRRSDGELRRRLLELPDFTEQ
jgi:hypothetical protein